LPALIFHFPDSQGNNSKCSFFPRKISPIAQRKKELSRFHTKKARPHDCGIVKYFVKFLWQLLIVAAVILRAFRPNDLLDRSDQFQSSHLHSIPRKNRSR
jgi:hypothetical protein